MPPLCGMAARNYRQRCRGQICPGQRGRSRPGQRGRSGPGQRGRSGPGQRGRSGRSRPGAARAGLATAARSAPLRGVISPTRSLIRTSYADLLSVPSASVESDRLRTPAGEVSQVPAPSVVARAVHRPAPAGDLLREALLARVQPATATVWADQDAELDAEMAALDV